MGETEAEVEQLLLEGGMWLSGLGVWGYVAAVVVMAAVAIFPIPAEVPAVVNGLLFGPAVGTLLTWTGAMAGALVSFELSRRLGRPLAVRMLGPAVLEAADRFVLRAGWWGMLFPRLVPLIAFTAVNWGAGLTPVPRWRFVWTTGLGILPGTVLFTASGTALGAMVRELSPLVAVLALASTSVAIGWKVLRQDPERWRSVARPVLKFPGSGER